MLSYARGEITEKPTSKMYRVKSERRRGGEGGVRFLHFLTGAVSTEMSFDKLLNISLKVILKPSQTISVHDIDFPKLFRLLLKDAENLQKNCYPDSLHGGSKDDFYATNLFDKNARPKPYLEELEPSENSRVDWSANSAEHNRIDREVQFPKGRTTSNTFSVRIFLLSRHCFKTKISLL